MNAQTKGADDSKSPDHDGQRRHLGDALRRRPRSAPRSSPRSSRNKIEETTNVNFNISVGTAVPASVRFHPLPPRIVEIYPEWRGYDVILVRGRTLSSVRRRTRSSTSSRAKRLG